MVRDFGITKNGEKVVCITIEDKEKNSVSILNYGATIQSLVIDNTDVVLGYDNILSYEENAGYLGATIGRCTNRIVNAAFSLNGKEYKLSENKPGLHHHGGFCGFSHKIWNYREIPCGVEMTLLSPDGDEGYPGKVEAKVTYRFENRVLSMEYDAVSDAETIINLTNHSYFNLDGAGEITGHTLQVNSEKIAAIDERGIPCGGSQDIKSTALDFSDPKLIEWALTDQNPLISVCHGIDHNYIIDGKPGDFRHTATLVGSKTNLKMEVYSNMEAMILYSGNYLCGQIGKNGRRYMPHSGICFENQYVSNAINIEGFLKPVFKPGEHFAQQTEFRF